MYDEQGRYDEALTTYQQVLTIIRDVGDRAMEDKILNNIGEVYGNQGDYVTALDIYQQSLTVNNPPQAFAL